MRVVRKTVLVSNLEIRIVIGLHPHEHEKPQRLRVSVQADIEPGRDERDDIEATLDYDRICDFLRAQAKEERVDLQETLARRVLAFTLSLPGVERAVVETRKPDVFDDCDFVGVRLEGVNDTGRPRGQG